jgi:hypothetical protein
MANTTNVFKNQGEEKPGTGTFGAVADRGREAAGKVADKARDAMSSVADKSRDAMSTVADKARDAASTVGQAASDAASTVGKKAEDATSAVGSGMKNLAGTIREHTPEGGVIGTASATVADTLEKSGRYLQEQGLSGIGEDLTGLIRRNPVPALLVGICLGYLVARATNRS